MTANVSTLGTLTLLTSAFRTGQRDIADLSQQLATGKKSDSLSGYGIESGRLLDLGAAVANEQAYVKTADTVSTYLSGYDNSLSDLVNSAKQLQKELNTSNSTAATLDGSFAPLVSGLSTSVTATLNGQIGDRYLFSGTRYTTAPVTDIGALPALASPAAFAASASPALAEYDSQYAGAGSSSSAAWATQSVTIADRETKTYGISSNDAAVQKLVFALRNAAAAENAPQPTRGQYLDLAKSAVADAIDGLNTLQASNGLTLSRVNDVKTAHTQSISSLQGFADGIQSVDSTEAAAKLSALQTQLQASYQATGKILSLSLASYLS